MAAADDELIREAQRRITGGQRRLAWSRKQTELHQQQAEIYREQGSVEQDLIEAERSRQRLLERSIMLEERRIAREKHRVLFTRIHENDPTLTSIDLENDDFYTEESEEDSHDNDLECLFEELCHNNRSVTSLNMGNWFFCDRTANELTKFFRLLPSMRSISAIKVRTLFAQAHLASFFRGVKEHGGISHALIHFRDLEGSLTFRRRQLIGLQELDLELDLEEGDSADTTTIIESFKSLSKALRKNKTIQNVSLSVTCVTSLESFLAFTEAIVTMPNLEMVTFKYSDWMPEEAAGLELELVGRQHEELLVHAIQQSRLLRQVKLEPHEHWAVDESHAAINDNLQYHLELKKIDLDGLLAADANHAIPLALWPFILAGSPAKRRRVDVLHRLLCSKPDVCNEANMRAHE